MSFSFPKSYFIYHFIKLHIFNNLQFISIWRMKLSLKVIPEKCVVLIFLRILFLLLIKPISCSYLCCKLKSHFISFSLQGSAVGSIKHVLQRNTSKLCSLVWDLYKDRASQLSFNLLIRSGVYLSCSHCMWSVLIFFM